VLYRQTDRERERERGRIKRARGKKGCGIETDVVGSVSRRLK